jgi:hypothetical protein
VRQLARRRGIALHRHPRKSPAFARIEAGLIRWRHQTARRFQ